MKSTIFIVMTVAALAATSATAETRVSFSTSIDHLSNDTPDWHESSVQLLRQYAPRKNASVALTQTERFGLHDNQISGMVTMPWRNDIVATVDANVSNTHRVLARQALGISLQYELIPAWLVHGGIRTTSYDAERVNQGLLMLECYFSSVSVVAAWRPTRAFDTTAHSGELRASYYYKDKSSVGMIVAGGKEAENIGGNIRLTSMRSVALVGRHWLSRDWALNYSASHTRQGDFYTRNGLNLGFQYAF